MTDPILIVGAGPTGLTAALELTRLGVPVRIIDKAQTPATTSRAIGMQARTLELLQQRGLAAEMLKSGNQAHALNLYGDGERVARLDYDPLESRFNYILIISQAETERVLREAIQRQGVTIERGVELIAVAQNPLAHDPSPAEAVLRHASGRLEQVRTPWLISAEGAHSIVRSTLDLSFAGETRREHYVLGDVLSDGELIATDAYMFTSTHGFMAVFPMGGNRFRLVGEAPLDQPDTEQDPSLDELQRIYDQRSGVRARLHDMSWSSWFAINSRMVDRLRVGRFLVGGDAAHIHSPAGGQGMNTGIQDMINLCWKLALVIQGKAPIALLDTYEQDRLPVMRNVLHKTKTMTDMAGNESPIFRSLFNHIAPYVGSMRAFQKNQTLGTSQLTVGYRESPLSANHAHGGTLHAGDRMPDLPVRRRSAHGWESERLLDLLDPSRFTLIVAQENELTPPDPALEAAIKPYGKIAKVLELAPASNAEDETRYRETLGRGSSFYLIRPDGYVGLAAGEHSIARQLAAYHERWLTPAAS